MLRILPSRPGDNMTAVDQNDGLAVTPCGSSLRGERMNYVVMFFAGIFLCNSIPHLTCGLRGESFPTPFAKPRGVGLSSPLLNFFWGCFNLVVGISLVSTRPVVADFYPTFIALVLGALAIGTYLSLHLAKVRRENSLN
jgi:hypothetical protein